MRILYCISGIFSRGGMERTLINKANYLAEHCYDVIIVTTEQQDREPAYRLDKRIRLYDLNIGYSLNRTRFWLQKAYYFFYNRYLHKKRLSKLIKQVDPDIIISLFGNDAGIISRLQCRAKKILEFHFSRPLFHFSSRLGVLGLYDKWKSTQWERMIRNFDRFVVLTYEDRANWNRLNNVVVIPNARSFDCAHPALLEVHKVLAVGRYVWQKGFDRLIQAWGLVNKKVDGWTLYIVGEGELRSSLQRQIQQLGLEQSIILTGSTAHIEDEYLSSSIFVQSSHFEGLSMALIESMSCGLPVVSFACPCGPRDIITDSEDGFLVVDGDIEMMANRLIYLMKHFDARKKMGEKAYNSSLRFTQDSVMRKWIALFNDVVNVK